MKGKLDVGDSATWWREATDQLAASQLVLRADHISQLQRLPPIHMDPFDRVLIAQAVTGKLVMLTIDKEILEYSSAGLLLL